jgi:signal recognition particle subunit SRP68
VAVCASTVLQEDGQYLLDRLDIYEAAISTTPGSKEPPRIAQIPPPFQSVPCRPIFLDTALNTISFPSLEARLKKKPEKRSFFSLWGGRK